MRNEGFFAAKSAAPAIIVRSRSADTRYGNSLGWAWSSQPSGPSGARRRSASVASSVLIAPHFLGLRDRLPDRMWVGHVDDGEFRFVSSGGNLDRPYPENAIDESLCDVYGADVLERDGSAVLTQDASLIHEFAVGDSQRSSASLDVPIQQDNDSDAKSDDQERGKLIQEFAVASAQDEEANAKGGDQ
jgi:hypothetical protein